MTTPKSLSLTEFITMLKRELAVASQARKPGETELVVKSATVEVEVSTEVDASAEGGLKFVVGEVKGGASRKKVVMHKLSLELVPDQVLLLGDKPTTSRLDE